MERLTSTDGICCECNAISYCMSDCHNKQIYDRLAYYEDLEEQGRLVVLPCKVGDSVWINGILGVGEAEEHEITAVSCHLGSKKEIWFNAEMPRYRGEARCSFGLDQFGKTVFLTREEAEQALKEDA